MQEMCFHKYMIALIVGVMCCVNSSAQFSSGSGTQTDPYIISTAMELQSIKDYLDKHFALGGDIDASEASGWNDGAGFEPIGSVLVSENPFTGSLDGRGHVVIGLVVNRLSSSGGGLFGKIGADGSVHNIGLNNVVIKGYSSVGGLVGVNEGKIYECYITGSVQGDNLLVGGLAGRNIGRIVACYTDVEVTGKWGYVGGFVGNNEGLILQSSSSGTLNSGYAGVNCFYIGGFVGSNTGEIEGCESDVDVMGSLASYVGGFVGGNHGSVLRCHASGTVAGRVAVGGFVGLAGNAISASMSYCYSSGNVMRTGGTEESIGGFAGRSHHSLIHETYSSGSVSYNDASNPINKGFVGEVVFSLEEESSLLRNYWDINLSGQDSTGGNYAFGRTTGQMKSQATFANWDFNNI